MIVFDDNFAFSGQFGAVPLQRTNTNYSSGSSNQSPGNEVRISKASKTVLVKAYCDVLDSDGIVSYGKVQD